MFLSPPPFVIIMVIVVLLLICGIVWLYVDNDDANTFVCKDKTLVALDSAYNMSAILHNHNKYIGLARSETNTFSTVIALEIDTITKKVTKRDLDFNKNDFHSVYNTGIQDPRIFTFRNKYWGIANCIGHKGQKNPDKHTMCLFTIENPTQSLQFLYPANEEGIRDQRNWSPFVYKNTLYCEYSIDPHIVYEIDTDLGVVKNVIASPNRYTSRPNTSNFLSGGAPPIYITHFREPYYLGIGHAKISKYRYYHFFYVFEAKPPFRIVGYTNVHKLDDREELQYVSGLSITGDDLHVSYSTNRKNNILSIYNIYEINYKIHYDPMHIRDSISASLPKNIPVCILAVDFEPTERLRSYAKQFGYNLRTLASYKNDHEKKEDMLVFLYKETLDSSPLNPSKEINFDSILHLAGEAKEIRFDGIKDRIVHSSIFYDSKEEYSVSIKRYMMDPMLQMGYPYRYENGIFLHKNYLHQILHQEPSLFRHSFTVMPTVIKPSVVSQRKTSIPKIIHQSFASRAVYDGISTAAYTFIHSNPDYEYRYSDDGDHRRLIVDHFDVEVVKAYDMLIPGAYKCDLWRACAIYVYGGIYVDIKFGAVYPMKDILDDDVDHFFINGIEKGAIYNAMFGAKPKSELIHQVIKTITKRVLRKEYGCSCLYPTGPLAMGNVVLPTLGFKGHMPIGKYKVKDYTICVYDDYVNWSGVGRIGLSNDKIVAHTRHNNKTQNHGLIKSVTGKQHYSILWLEGRIYKDL